MAQIDSELVRLLMRVGYIAAWNGLPKEALAIFQGVGAARPESEIPMVGVAVVAMLSGNYEVAVQTLEQGALVLRPDSALARAHLGVALRLRGDEEQGVGVLREVMAQGTDPDAVAMARNVLAMTPTQLQPNLKHL